MALIIEGVQKDHSKLASIEGATPPHNHYIQDNALVKVDGLSSVRSQARKDIARGSRYPTIAYSVSLQEHRGY